MQLAIKVRFRKHSSQIRETGESERASERGKGGWEKGARITRYKHNKEHTEIQNIVF